MGDKAAQALGDVSASALVVGAAAVAGAGALAVGASNSIRSLFKGAHTTTTVGINVGTSWTVHR